MGWILLLDVVPVVVVVVEEESSTKSTCEKQCTIPSAPAVTNMEFHGHSVLELCWVVTVVAHIIHVMAR